MHIVTLIDTAQYEYLKHVLETYTRNGLAASELPIAANLYVRIMQAQEVDETHLGKASVAAMGPNGVALEVENVAS
jgi:hypothetical protein